MLLCVLRQNDSIENRQANLLCGLQKFACDEARKRQSIPKFSVFNNALLTAYRGKGFDKDYVDPMISMIVASSMPFASIFLAISRLRWFMPFSKPSALPSSLPFW